MGDPRNVGPLVVLAGITALLALGVGMRERAPEVPAPVHQSAGGGGGSTAMSEDSTDVVSTNPLATPVGLDRKLEELTDQVRRQPWALDQLLELAQLLDDSHRPLEAAQQYERYLTARPHSRSVWLLLTNAYGTMGDWSQAADASHRLLRQFPDDPWAMYNLGAALANQGRYEDARGWWERVLEGEDSAMTKRALTALERLADFEDI